jgi:uncharacterized membrane protein YqhA
MLMKRLLENGKYLILVVVIVSLALCLASLVWGIYEAVNVVINLFTNYKGVTATIGSFVQLMDIFLIVAVLYIFTVAMYELFIGELDLPQWLAVHNFDQLKAILGNMVVLIMAVAFLKYFLERNDPVATVLYAVGVAVVALTLILYRRHEPGDSH